MSDFKNSFRIYLARVMNITFYIWIASMVLSLISSTIYALPYGWIIPLAINLAAIVLLNPLPEFIYQTHHAELSIFTASYEFIKENFIEWLIPNIVLMVALYYTLMGNMFIFGAFDVMGIVKYLVGLFVLLYSMIYRGILFRFLNESTRRSRLFKLRMLDI